jgi:serine/threonine protein kinase
LSSYFSLSFFLLPSGIQFIHANRWLHLDLKPFNIVFSKKRDDYDLRIIDFGLARELGEGHSVKVRMCG